MLGCFLAEGQGSGLTRSKLAKRLGKRPEQITRWLAAPGNLTLDTISDLLLTMNAEIDPKVAAWPQGRAEVRTRGAATTLKKTSA